MFARKVLYCHSSPCCSLAEGILISKDRERFGETKDIVNHTAFHLFYKNVIYFITGHT
jgi:hypothetical protein